MICCGVISVIVYVVAALGNSGSGGLQTSGTPANTPGAIGVASVENEIQLLPIIISPDGSYIPYESGLDFGGWNSIVNSTIVVNGQFIFHLLSLITDQSCLDPDRAVSDGCTGPSKPVAGAVVLFSIMDEDSCKSGVRCDLAAAAGATGCLLYNGKRVAGCGSFSPSYLLFNLILQAHQLFLVATSN